MLKVINEKLGNILVSQGLITEEALKKALAEQEKRGFKQRPIGSFLAEMGYVSEVDILKALGIQFNLPIMELKEVTVEPAVLALIPEAMARRFQVLPLYLVEKELSVAFSDPTQIELMDTLASQTRLKIQPILALGKEIGAAIDYNYSSKMKSVTRQPQPEEAPMTASEVKRLEEAGKELPIIRLVDDLFLQAVQEGVSDIHVEPRETTLVVRFRIDGILKEVQTFSNKQTPAIISRIKIVSKLDISERQKPQDGRIKIKLNEREIDLRVSTLPTYYGEKVVLRLLDQQKVQLGLEEMAFSGHNLALLKNMIIQPYGLILVTGPTGSGKSTTLYAAINAVNSETKNIITVEDPIEYQVPMINQVQVNSKKDLTFASALRSILRQDPNVILIGEIRDHETGEIATEAALTGHLVLSTLHTNDAPSAIARLIEMKIEPFLLAPSLLGIVAQRLARKICPNCKEQYPPKKEELERLGLPQVPPGLKFSRGKGCASCKGKGYKGRIAIHEILAADDTIRSLITQKAPAPVIRNHALQGGFIDMRLDGIRKMVQGDTTLEEVLRVTRSV